MPSHHDYLTDTDLRTAEDVAKWLLERANTEFRGEFITEDASELHADLSRRLDRERRQACRRACFEMFAHACKHRRWMRDARAKGVGSDQWFIDRNEARVELLVTALAYRAAARAK